MKIFTTSSSQLDENSGDPLTMTAEEGSWFGEFSKGLLNLGLVWWNIWFGEDLVWWNIWFGGDLVWWNIVWPSRRVLGLVSTKVLVNSTSNWRSVFMCKSKVSFLGIFIGTTELPWESDLKLPAIFKSQTCLCEFTNPRILIPFLLPASIFVVGCLTGSLVGGYQCDILGRRWA